MDDKNVTVGFCSNLRGNWLYGVESCILLFLASLSVTLNFIYMKVLCSCGGHLPLTTKYLLINCSFASLVKSAFYFLYYPTYNFVLLIFGFDALSVTKNTCIIIAAIFATATYAIPVSMLFIGCERLYSTWKKNLAQVERMTAKLIIAQTFIWITAILIYITIIYADNLPAKPMCYCHLPMLIGPNGGVVSNVVLIGTQSLNVVIYGFIYWKNKMNLFQFTINTARYSLTERFVMWANINTTLMLLPMSLLHAFTYSTVTVASRVAREAFNFTVTDNYLCVIIGLGCFMCLDTLGHPLLCLKFGRKLGEIAAKLYPKFGCFFARSNTVDIVQDRKDLKCEAINTVSKTFHRTRQNTQNTLTPVSNAQRSHFRPVTEYRIKPEEHQDILLDMWNKDDKKKKNMNKSLKRVSRPQ